MMKTILKLEEGTLITCTKLMTILIVENANLQGLVMKVKEHNKD